MLKGWLRIHEKETAQSRNSSDINAEREKYQNMTQSRRKEATESNAGENSSLQDPQRLNLGCDSKVAKTEEALV